MNLLETPLFRGINPAELPALLREMGAAERKFHKGRVILPQGDPAARLGLVCEGRVLLERTDVWGGNSVLGSAGPGEVFAAAYACVPETQLLSSVTAAEETTVLLLRVAPLYEASSLSGAQALLLRNLLELCARQSQQLSRRIMHTAPKTIRGRLTSYLSECARRAGSPVFTIPYNRQQLADYLEVDRSCLCTELTRMRQDGLLQCERNRFRLFMTENG